MGDLGWLERRIGSSGSWTTISSSATDTPRTVSGLVCNTSYTFRIRGYGNGTTYAADWGPTSTAPATTHPCPTPTPSPPPTPAGFTATATGKTSVSLRWDSRDGVSKYRYRTGSGSWTETLSTSDNVSSGLAPSTTYTFSVSGYGDGTTYASKWGPAAMTTATTSDEPPTNEPPTITGGPSATSYAENQTVTVATYTATDPDPGDTISWSLSGDDAGRFSISGGNLAFASPPNFEAPTDSGGNNIYNVKVVVTDDGSPEKSANRAVAITVTNVNEAPTAVQIAGQTLTVGGSTDIDLSDKFSDPDGDTLTYSASSSDTGVVTASVTGATLTLTPVAAGSTTVRVTASDPDGLSIYQDFVVAVEPSVAFGSPPSNITVGQPHSFNVNVSGTAQGVKYKVSVSLAPDDETAGFNQDCSANSTEAVFDGMASAIFSTFTLHGCHEATGLTLNAKLLQDTGVNPNDFTWADVKTISTPFSVSATAPGTPLNLTVTPGDGSLKVEWTGPSDKGGADILQYKVQHRSTPSSPSQWPSSTLTNTKQVGKGTTQVTIEGLTYGESYDVRVQACNVVGCGAWSASVSGAPTLPSLAKPVIDVKPLPLRKAEISWTGDTNADEYILEAQAFGGTWNSPDQVTVSATSKEIELDEVIPDRGLADAPYAYEFRVKATDSYRNLP